jgi:creatinine amidohydrolase
MALIALADSSYPALAALDRQRTVPVLAIGALEAHGPHLPLDTDVRIARGMIAAAAARLPELDLLELPALVYSPAGFAASFAGTVDLAPEAHLATLRGLGRTVAAMGFSRFAWANAHFDPANVGVLRAAAAELRGEGLDLRFPDLTRRALAARLGEEFQSGACHAGRYETSLVLALTPAAVDTGTSAGLARLDHSLSEAIRRGVRTFSELGADRAYVGDPAAATAAEGHALLAELGAILAEAITAPAG